jgi:hypothetical protein
VIERRSFIGLSILSMGCASGPKASGRYPFTDKGPNLDELIADYQRRFESVTNVGGDTVCYDRETWDGVRAAFSRIVAECVGRKA